MDKLTKEDKELECINIGICYRSELYDFIYETHIMNKKSMITLIEKILLTLNANERDILYYEFMEPKEKGWWKDIFDEKTFYNIKTQAIDSFLHCLYS